MGFAMVHQEKRSTLYYRPAENCESHVSPSRDIADIDGSLAVQFQD